MEKQYGTSNGHLKWTHPVYCNTDRTSLLPLDNWHDFIADGTLADAILDRLVHNAYKINMKGESMRKWYVKKDDPDIWESNEGQDGFAIKVAGFLRDARPLCSGLGGRLRPEWVAGLSGIHTIAPFLSIFGIL